LEQGTVVLLRDLHFDLDESERRFLTPALLNGRSKNISFRPTTGALAGVKCDAADSVAMMAMMRRYYNYACDLACALCPEYGGRIKPGFASFRPADLADRTTSWRKDDSRLHVDAFPSRPMRGKRILRVFTNVHPSKPRVWRVGEPFHDVAARFLPRVGPQWPGSAWLRARLGITKGERSAYDHLMLGIHDAMKRDTTYQREAPQSELAIPPGATWACFTDVVSHAAMSGQFCFEQTFHVPVEAMRDPEKSP